MRASKEERRKAHARASKRWKRKHRDKVKELNKKYRLRPEAKEYHRLYMIAWRKNKPKTKVKKEKTKLLLVKRKAVSAKERRMTLQINQDNLIKKRDSRIDQYLRLCYSFHTGVRGQKRNYLAYLNREADFIMYLNMKEINPAKWKALEYHLESRHTLPTILAAKIRKEALTGKRHIGFPPYIPQDGYDKTASPIYQAANFGTLPNYIIHHDGYYLMRLEC